jgi:hypothetical protein
MNAPAAKLPKGKQLLLGWLLMALALILGGGLIIAGFIGFAKSVVKSVESIENSQDGSLTLDVSKRSQVYIFTPNGTSLDSIRVTGPDGPVSVRTTSSSIEVNTPDTTGTAVAQFSASQPGSYTITADGESFSAGANVFDVGKLKLAGIGALIGALAGLTGLILVITAAVSRGREKKARLAATTPYTQWGQQPGYPQQTNSPQQPGYPQPANPPQPVYQQPQAPLQPPPPPPPPAQ